jgi:hypothetical protein
LPVLLLVFEEAFQVNIAVQQVNQEGALRGRRRVRRYRLQWCTLSIDGSDAELPGRKRRTA